jgi:hypothetical protein
MRKVSLLEMKLGLKASTFKKNERKLVVQAGNARFDHKVRAERAQPPLGVIRT